MTYHRVVAVVVVFVFAVYAQDVLAPAEETTAVQNDTTAGSISEKAEENSADECYPPCRTGFLCHRGECIERCNPPCPDGTRCNARAECIPVNPPRQLSSGRPPVATISTVPANTSIRIEDGDWIAIKGPTQFKFPREDSYTVEVKCPGYFHLSTKVGVENGKNTDLNLFLKKVKFHGNFGFSLATPLPVDDPFMGISGELGVALPNHRIGAAFNVAFNPEIDSNYANTHNNLLGGGAVYRFTGIGNRFKFVPGIVVGVWRFNGYYFINTRTSTTVNGRVISSSFTYDLKHHTTYDFVNPQIMLIWLANKKISIRYQMGFWFGQQLFMDMANIGMLLSL
ncbi:MAG: hypothetical protein JW863_08680 [Chitinispirillaceae bacterium]|nr:hypothetical protein [Chitinispirillaceae bacterium]